MIYDVKFSERALKALKRMDKYQAKIILAWINKNLIGCSDPRQHGKALLGDKKGYWRYRVGSYRIIAEIDDYRVRINIINTAHRSEVYDK